MHLWLALFDIDRAVLENIDIDKEILENIDIDKILNRLEFGIANRASSTCIWTHCLYLALQLGPGQANWNQRQLVACPHLQMLSKFCPQSAYVEILETFAIKLLKFSFWEQNQCFLAFLQQKCSIFWFIGFRTSD